MGVRVLIKVYLYLTVLETDSLRPGDYYLLSLQRRPHSGWTYSRGITGKKGRGVVLLAYPTPPCRGLTRVLRMPGQDPSQPVTTL